MLTTLSRLREHVQIVLNAEEAETLRKIAEHYEVRRLMDATPDAQGRRWDRYNQEVE